jgi:D-alanyl-D-alanine carboxypeptidase/D-alanyl-D-alanine-endopeptidase (penicillin-binding protein 4)
MLFNKIFSYNKNIYLYFEPMKKFLFLTIFFVAILLSSCSLSKKINRPAKEYLLDNGLFVNAHTGISIYEPATGKYWYNYQADKYFTPASNTKLATCYAAMKYLDDSIIGLKYNAINDSTVIIKGMGDPTFLHNDFTRNPVFDFLKKYKHIQIVNSHFDDYLGSGWAWGDYLDYYMAQRSEFPLHGNTVTVDWINDHNLSFLPSYFQHSSTINGILSKGYVAYKPWDTNYFTFTEGNTTHSEIPFRPDEKTLRNLLQDTLKEDVETIENYSEPFTGFIHSQPTDSLLKPMMHRSDNFFAEQSLLMVSQKILGYLNDRKVIDTLLKTDYSQMPQKPDWVDGSGLSRYDLFSPKDFIFILNKMKNDFGMERIKNILPTGGTGTISSYYIKDSGYIFVKTGTLNGVVALSGFLYTKKSKLLIFSILVNNHRGSATSIRKGIEKFIQYVRNKY